MDNHALRSGTAESITMNRFITALILAVFAAALLPTIAEAKRLGGGGTSGMQRSLPTRTAPDAVPARPAPAAPAAAPNAVPPTPAAAAPKRSWMGPLAGLAAGLGIAALMSHFGMGAELGNFVTMALIAVAAFIAIRFLMARFGPGAQRAAMRAPQGMQFAGASAGGGQVPVSLPAVEPSFAAPTGAASTSSSALPLPAGFDSAAFERIAKMIFIRMQTANDASDLNDLRAFTTPEMFASVKLDLQDRGTTAQQTDVVKIDAQVIDFAAETDRQLVSVRFHGLIREERDGVAAPFDEVWHLVKPTDGSREWAIAGIQQTA